MAEKPGYWDVQRCAWAYAESTDVAPRLPEPTAAEAPSRSVDAAVPEQRPDLAASPVAGTPD